MRTSARWILAVLVSLAGCANPESPGTLQSVYALHRIGTQILPVPTWEDPNAPLLIADTLFIPADVSTPAGSIITEIRVTKGANDQSSRESQRFAATQRADALLINDCPVGSFCIASLIYSSSAFQFVGDSLFEQLPASGSRKPRVYARVRTVR